MTDKAAGPDGSDSSARLGLVTEREHFEAWCRNWGAMSVHHQAVAWDAWQAMAEMRNRAVVERDRLKAERDGALRMLAEWCIAVDTNGTGWDDWDEHYKDAMYRAGPLRELLDRALAKVRDERRPWDLGA